MTTLYSCRTDGDLCIEYQGQRNDDGYGIINREGAHRVEWKKHHGPIPLGLHVLHRCDNPACINIKHLFLGTHQDNIKDRDAKNRQAKPKGTDNGRSMLTEAEVAFIKECFKNDSHSLSELATMFGVCRSTIVHIKVGRTWRHVA